MVVEEIMAYNPHSAQVTESIGDVLAQLMEVDVRHLPILEDGSLVGIVSDRDLRSVAPGGVFEDTGVLNLPVSRIMSSDVLTVNPETDVADVIDLMIENKIGAVPVVEADSDKLVGIVSYVDALRAARDSL